MRDSSNAQHVSVEFVRGQIRTFVSTDRDALVATLLDGVRAAGNKDVSVTSQLTRRGYRLGE